MTGSPIATNEPNAISSTTIAAARPIAPAPPAAVVCVCSMAAPPSSTSRFGERAFLAVEITRSTVAFDSAGACSSKVTVANAIRPSAEIWVVPAA